MLVAPASSSKLVVGVSCLTAVFTWSMSRSSQIFTLFMEVIASLKKTDKISKVELG